MSDPTVPPWGTFKPKVFSPLPEPPDWLYANVNVFPSVDADEQGKRAIAVGGPFWAMSIERSYLLAARRLLEKGEDVAALVLPIAYLQRHAFEVALKNLLDAARYIARRGEWLEDLEADPTAGPPLEPKAVVESGSGDAKTHNLRRLIELLEPALGAIGYGPLPGGIDAMAQKLVDLEANMADRWRYGAVLGPKGKGKGPVSERNFIEPKKVPVEADQIELERLFEKHLCVVDWEHAEADDGPLVGTLALEAMGIDQALRARGVE